MTTLRIPLPCFSLLALLLLLLSSSTTSSLALRHDAANHAPPTYDTSRNISSSIFLESDDDRDIRGATTTISTMAKAKLKANDLSFPQQLELLYDLNRILVLTLEHSRRLNNKATATRAHFFLGQTKHISKRLGDALAAEDKKEAKKRAIHSHAASSSSSSASDSSAAYYLSNLTSALNDAEDPSQSKSALHISNILDSIGADIINLVLVPLRKLNLLNTPDWTAGDVDSVWNLWESLQCPLCIDIYSAVFTVVNRYGCVAPYAVSELACLPFSGGHPSNELGSPYETCTYAINKVCHSGLSLFTEKPFHLSGFSACGLITLCQESDKRVIKEMTQAQQKEEDE